MEKSGLGWIATGSNLPATAPKMPLGIQKPFSDFFNVGKCSLFDSVCVGETYSCDELFAAFRTEKHLIFTNGAVHADYKCFCEIFFKSCLSSFLHFYENRIYENSSPFALFWERSNMRKYFGTLSLGSDMGRCSALLSQKDIGGTVREAPRP